MEDTKECEKNQSEWKKGAATQKETHRDSQEPPHIFMSFTDLTTEMNIAVDTFKLHLPNQTERI